MPPFALLGVLLAQAIAPAPSPVLTASPVPGPSPVTTTTTTTSSTATTTSSTATTMDVAPVAPDAPSAVVPVAPTTDPAWRPRRFGLHLGLNGTLLFDASFGRYAYTGFATQLTGAGAIADPSRNYVLSALAFGGVALPLVERASVRLTADVTPALSFFRSAPVNMLNVGLLAGVRLQHASGFTVALKLPLVGWAAAPDAQRASLLYYYIGAIVTVPALTLGYSF
jgi:hypothetical protein